MSKYLLKRLLLILPTFLGISLITYSMVRLAPGDYTSLRAGMQGELKTTAAAKQAMEEERRLYGLDKPIITGYFEWLGRMVVLDFGTSRKDGRPVSARIAESLPITLALNIISMVLVYIISIPAGIVSALKKDSLYDRVSSVALFVLYSLPSFWVGLLLLMVLSGGEFLNLFPLGGIVSDGAADYPWYRYLGDVTWHLVLPVVTLTYGGFAFLARYMRANLLEVISQQYIVTARAKGLGRSRVVFIHAFRNSLVPLVTLMASILPGLLGGSVIVESIFSIPGMGLLAFEAILSRDIPVIMAIASISAMLTLMGILVADIMYSVVDPRIRLEAKA
ncbi:MAG: ABC transporter permease [Spirochaetes bacterium]|nr:MAG: ABC transporter permease [Spirochaetota bacterium]